MTCTCNKTPANAVVHVYNAKGELVHAYNKNCEEHGITSITRPMKEITRRAEMTLDQALSMRHMVDGMKLVHRAPGAMKATMEWIDYELFPENEIA